MERYLVGLLVLATVALIGCGSTRVESDAASGLVDDGMPFGKITDSDLDQLMQYAKKEGVDLGAELDKAYAKDMNALANVFRFSLAMKSLDQNTRTYGQVIYSSFLNLGETMGTEQYSEVVVAQEPDVQQRIRDFLYFPVTCVPREVRAQVDKRVREEHPKLFPEDYQFGHGNPLFER
jgi:hypothetical protein